jgi:hypothetical protein
MAKVKLTVTIDAALDAEIRRSATLQASSLSSLVESALRDWARSERERSLADGYRAMAGEDAATADANLASGAETLE